jgi:hypothetical protein
VSEIAAGEAPVGALVFLPCGCGGVCGLALSDAPVLIRIEGPCNMHAGDGALQIRYVDRYSRVSVFTRPRDLSKA